MRYPHSERLRLFPGWLRLAPRRFFRPFLPLFSSPQFLGESFCLEYRFFLFPRFELSDCPLPLLSRLLGLRWL